MRQAPKGHHGEFPSFEEGLSEMYRIYRKVLHPDEGDFEILAESGMY